MLGSLFAVLGISSVEAVDITISIRYKRLTVRHLLTSFSYLSIFSVVMCGAAVYLRGIVPCAAVEYLANVGYLTTGVVVLIYFAIGEMLLYSAPSIRILKSLSSRNGMPIGFLTEDIGRNETFSLPEE
jgi:hypothetical protein